jgi:hypothetical protein
MTEIILNDTVHISGEAISLSGHSFRATDLLNMTPNDTTVTAKTVGHGSHVVRNEDIRRGQRTVGLTGWTEADNFEQLDARLTELEQWPEQHVTLRFVGMGRDVEATGIWTLERPDELWPALTAWSATLLCESPYLLSHEVQTLYLQASATSEGGLQWGPAGLFVASAMGVVWAGWQLGHRIQRWQRFGWADHYGAWVVVVWCDDLGLYWTVSGV